MSNTKSPTFKGTDTTYDEILKSITASAFNKLLANRIPVSVADKLSRQIASNIDLVNTYDVIANDIQTHKVPKQRILDRTIVHMFEILFRIINNYEIEDNKITEKEFFNLVPRGECLDIFLQLVKEYCMGDVEIKRYTGKMEPLILTYQKENAIDWNSLYKSDEFKAHITGMFHLILKHLRDDQKPIPAIENKIPIQYNPYRINFFLNQVCKLNKSGQLNFDEV